MMDSKDFVKTLNMVWEQTKKVIKLKTVGAVTAGATVAYFGWTYLSRDEVVFNNVIMPVARMLPPERSHNLAIWAFKNKFFPLPDDPDDINLQTTFFGHTLENPIGIAAGFDKNGEAIEGLQEMGFGFVEVGSVTPKPQPGNDMPRVFRLEEDFAVINRYGFNNDGHKAVLERVSSIKNDQNTGVVGVNLGRNKKTKNAIDDYVQGVKVFGPVADYLVINVSSPNTKGVRNLQYKRRLEALLTEVINARNELEKNNNVPILLKLSPDLSRDEIRDIATVLNKKECRVDGLVVSNTTVSRNNLKEVNMAKETGGLSGEPLRDRSTQMVAIAYNETKGKIPIIGVGGISSGKDAFEKIEAGASYLQFYTALAYYGPTVVTNIKTELSEILAKEGYINVQEAVGKNNKKYLPE